MDTVNIKGMEIPISGYNKINGQDVPIIKAETEEIRHSDGRVDIIVHVPCLKMELKSKEE